MEKNEKNLKKLVENAERKIRSERKKADRTDWEGNYPEDRR